MKPDPNRRAFRRCSKSPGLSSRLFLFAVALLLAWTGALGEPRATASPERVVFEQTSPFHHIRVLDDDWVRRLSFDGSTESQMSLTDPLRRHYEYTEYFHMPWLWNPRMSNVLMIGLGGASAQRAYAHDYPDVSVETVELDRVVLHVAKDFFHFQEGPNQKVHIEDGRVFLRRNPRRYDALIVDAYTSGRYGSSIPYPLATREFFELAHQRLTTNGVLAYNVIAALRGYQADILGAVYRTMKTVFPQVYQFPARESQNVVLVATKASEAVTLPELQQRANSLIRSQRVKMWSFRQRVGVVRVSPPPNAQASPILTDDFAPVDGLLNSRSLPSTK